VSTDRLYGFGRIIVQNERTDSGTADRTRMTALWLDSRVPTTTWLTYEGSQRPCQLHGDIGSQDLNKLTRPKLLILERDVCPILLANLGELTRGERLGLLTFGNISSPQICVVPERRKDEDDADGLETGIF
jgi:hypothetical protein